MSAKAASYVNELVDKFSSNYEVVFSKNVIDIDFYKIMTYDKILFGYSTFAWWAATLSNASQVGVFGPWRAMKKTGNKNLGQTNYPGWLCSCPAAVCGVMLRSDRRRRLLRWRAP